MKSIHTIPLANGLSLEVIDQSNRYFGDYYRVRMILRLEIPLERAGLDSATLAAARAVCGEQVIFERVLERMGIAGAAVEQVREELVTTFLASTRSYLEHPDFGRRLVRRQLDARQRLFPGPLR